MILFVVLIAVLLRLIALILIDEYQLIGWPNASDLLRVFEKLKLPE